MFASGRCRRHGLDDWGRRGLKETSPKKKPRALKMMEGAFGVVTRVEEFAHKKSKIGTLRKEYDLMKVVCGHPNVVRVYALTDNEHTLVMLDGGRDLITALEKPMQEGVPWSSEDACDVFFQIVSALQHVHSCGVAHNDVKLENVLIDDQGCVTLIDFGLSEQMERGLQFIARRGTEQYLAPETFLRPTYDPYPADLWSLGVIAVALCTLTFPFNAAHKDDPLFQRYLVLFNTEKPEPAAALQGMYHRKALHERASHFEWYTSALNCTLLLEPSKRSFPEKKGQGIDEKKNRP